MTDEQIAVALERVNDHQTMVTHSVMVSQIDAAVAAETERCAAIRKDGDIEIRKAVARRCEYLARYRGNLATAADIRREYDLEGK